MAMMLMMTMMIATKRKKKKKRKKGRLIAGSIDKNEFNFGSKDQRDRKSPSN